MQYEEPDIRAPPQPIFSTGIAHHRRASHPATYAVHHHQPSQLSTSHQWQQYMANMAIPADDTQMPTWLTVDNDAQSRRASTSTTQSSLPVSPDDATPIFSPNTGFASDYFSAMSGQPSALGKRSYQAAELDYGNQHQYTGQFGAIPVPTSSHDYMPSLQVFDQPVSSFAKPLPLFPARGKSRPASTDLSNKRPRLQAIVETEGLPITANVPASDSTVKPYNKVVASVSSPVSAPTLHLHPDAVARPGNYRRLSSPIASIRPEVGVSEGLDSDEDEEEDGRGETDLVDTPSFQTTFAIKTSSDSESEYVGLSGAEPYLPHQQQGPSVLSTAPYMPVSTTLPGPLQPATASSSSHTLIAVPTFSGTRSLPVLSDTNDEGTSDGARQQKLRFDQDLYTPLWVRGNAASKEGFCDMCDPGKWLQLKNSAFW